MLTLDELIKQLQELRKDLPKDLPIRLERFTGENTVTLNQVKLASVRGGKKHTPTLGVDSLPLITDQAVVLLKGG